MRGCIAVLQLDDKAEASLNASKDGRVLVAGLDGKPLAIPLSFKGYTDAANAYRSEEAKRSSWLRTLVMKLSHLGLIVATALLPLPVLAQNAAPPAPQPQQPAGPVQPTNVKPIGDWTVRCFPVASASPCDMYEELDDKNTRQRVLSVSIAYVPSTDRNVVQIAVPLGVSLASGAIMKTDSYTSPKMPFRRCDRDGCYVELALPEDMINAMAKSGPKGSLNIVADNGKSFALRFSLDGFSGAHDAMTNLAKDKVKTSVAPAAAAKK